MCVELGIFFGDEYGLLSGEREQNRVSELFSAYRVDCQRHLASSRCSFSKDP